MPRLPNDLVSCLQLALQQHLIALIACDQQPQLAMLMRNDLLDTLNQSFVRGEY